MNQLVTASNLILTGLMVAAFALVHLFIGRLTFLSSLPRSRWLSFAGGVAVTYVFMHILPELAQHNDAFASELRLSQKTAEVLVYGVALAGLALFYGVERLVKVKRGRFKERQAALADEGLLWVHLASFAVYNALIGYLLLHREEEGVGALFLYFIAMSLHFVTADFGMRDDHARDYDRIARWVLAGSVTAGWLVGIAIALPPLAIGVLFAFLAGGVVLNVLKEELPEERQSRFVPFLLGVGVFAVLVAGEGMVG